MKHELAALGSNSRRPSNESSAQTVIALFAADNRRPCWPRQDGKSFSVSTITVTLARFPCHTQPGRSFVLGNVARSWTDGVLWLASWSMLVARCIQWSDTGNAWENSEDPRLKEKRGYRNERPETVLPEFSFQPLVPAYQTTRCQNTGYHGTVFIAAENYKCYKNKFIT